MHIRPCLPILVIPCLAIALSACGGSGPPVQRVSFVIRADTVGGLPTSPGTSFVRTSHYFGSAGIRGSLSHPLSDACQLELPTIGFLALFFSFGDHATRRNCTDFGEAIVSGPRWHTVNGLGVGASLADLHRLFPDATSPGRVIRKPWWGAAGGSTEWILEPNSWPAGNHAAHTFLSAYVKHGHVVAFGQGVSGH